MLWWAWISYVLHFLQHRYPSMMLDDEHGLTRLKGGLRLLGGLLRWLLTWITSRSWDSRIIVTIQPSREVRRCLFLSSLQMDIRWSVLSSLDVLMTFLQSHCLSLSLGHCVSFRRKARNFAVLFISWDMLTMRKIPRIYICPSLSSVLTRRRRTCLCLNL